MVACVFSGITSLDLADNDLDARSAMELGPALKVCVLERVVCRMLKSSGWDVAFILSSHVGECGLKTTAKCAGLALGRPTELLGVRGRGYQTSDVARMHVQQLTRMVGVGCGADLDVSDSARPERQLDRCRRRQASASCPPTACDHACVLSASSWMCLPMSRSVSLCLSVARSRARGLSISLSLFCPAQCFSRFSRLHIVCAHPRSCELTPMVPKTLEKRRWLEASVGGLIQLTSLNNIAPSINKGASSWKLKELMTSPRYEAAFLANRLLIHGSHPLGRRCQHAVVFRF
eukprot:3883901-Rhodomonas_salina.6